MSRRNEKPLNLVDVREAIRIIDELRHKGRHGQIVLLPDMWIAIPTVDPVKSDSQATVRYEESEFGPPGIYLLLFMPETLAMALVSLDREKYKLFPAQRGRSKCFVVFRLE